MDQLIKTTLLGIIQGLTEWFPISSTGHLRLFEHFLNLSAPILFDAILHVGTLIVVLFFFRKDIKNMLSALVGLDFETEDGKMVPLIVVGTIPTVLIGLIFGEFIEDTFQTILPIAVAFAFCGILLFSSKVGKEKAENVDYLSAVAIGTMQGIAIIPGISRSGATISVALLLGIKREEAFKFSFLLSIPTILGAFCFTMYSEFDELIHASLGGIEILAGVVMAMLVGYFALKLLWKTIAKKKFHLFAFYCWLLSAILAVLFSGVF